MLCHLTLTAGLGCAQLCLVPSARLGSFLLGLVQLAQAQACLHSPWLFLHFRCNALLGSAMLATWSYILPEGQEGTARGKRGTKSAALILEAFLRKKWNKTVLLLWCIHFFSHQSHSPVMMGVV